MSIFQPKIIFFGTPEFAQIILQKLIDNGYKPALVVTAPDKPIGRKQVLTPTPVKVLAKKHKIPILQPEKLDDSFIYKLKTKTYNLIIVAAYGKIIPKSILDIPKYNAINVHPSLLPKLRGASPIQYAILNGDKTTGVTIMLMDEKMDHGPILANRKSQIAAGDTTEILSKKLVEIGADLLIETIPKWIGGKIKPKPQNHKSATFTKIIKREDGRIDWNKSADEIERMFRAFTPWPGIFTMWNGKRLKILSLSIMAAPRRNIIGQIITYKKGFAVQTRKGLIVPKEVQLEGKNPQSVEEFLRAHPLTKERLII